MTDSRTPTSPRWFAGEWSAGKSSAGIFRAGILILCLAFLAGCGAGLPDNIRDAAKQIPKEIDTAGQQIQKRQDQYARLKADPAYKRFERFAKKENWDGKFQAAAATITRAETLYDAELNPLIKKNDPNSAMAVSKQIKRIRTVIQEGLELARYPSQRYARLSDTVRDMAALRKTAMDQANLVTRAVDRLATGPVAKARADFPDSTPAIDKRFAPFTRKKSDTQAYAQTIDAIYKDHQGGGEADYAAFVDKADAISGFAATMPGDSDKLEKDLDKLYQSYTKVLQDMKADLYVTIRRESWDERSDYYNPRTVNFRRQVDPVTFENLANSNLDAIAALTYAYGNSQFHNYIGNLWSALKIKPTAQWPGLGHNAAEFWIADLSADYFHKYLVEENGETTETDWVKVKPSFYEQHYQDLGMAILSKPFGEFEPDANASPPGMAFVGNPRYGEWQTDDNGDQFWSWYGRYAFFSNLFFFPPTFYYYNSWYGWHRNYRYKKPYYGKSKTGGTIYGTFGSRVKKSPRFQSTTFAKTGGFKSPTPSVRGAGARVRGGGPGGKGK